MRVLPFFAVCLVLGLLMPLTASAQDLDAVRAERARIQERLDAAAERLGELEASVAGLSAEEEALERQIAGLTAEVAAAASRIEGRVRELYMRGDTHPMVALLGGSNPQAAVERATLMQRLVTADTQDAEVASAARTRLAAATQQLTAKKAQLEAAFAEQRELLDALEHDLEDAKALEQKLEAEERARQEAARRRAAAEARRQREQAEAVTSAPASAGGMVCPVDSPRSFTDTWGAPRSGGRTHKGTDILAPRGQTVRAIVSGVWDIRSYGSSAGNWGILRGSDGNNYYYMHLERHTVGDGARVGAGQQIATNGDTGNARGTTPHVHFELHPGGGYAVNPYPTLKRVCG
ncbi:MAG: peptidoglycan DD-metalloendopeptidase family protein [Nitriliruptorales bacterium]|nr:peptidoglycan DD-metalloendopeptidase family protein [Nitriliruptorales bacterium]